jgi:cyclase
VNTAAVKDPGLITTLAREFGSQCVVLAIDTKQEEDGEWYVYLNGGRLRTNSRTLDWARQAVSLGAGEILLTSMNHDGVRQGFALDITRAVVDAVSVPVIASGGGGTMEHFRDVFQQSSVDAALAASVFHFNEIKIPALKDFLTTNNIPVRK